jgi:hypothetical protein
MDAGRVDAPGEAMGSSRSRRAVLGQLAGGGTAAMLGPAGVTPINPKPAAQSDSETCCEPIVRGYFGLGDHEHVVHVTCDADFRLNIWARNVETTDGGVQILTPPSQFRGSGSSGPQDGLVLDVPAQTGMDLGGIGAQKGEVVDISSAGGARVAVFLTVVTCSGAKVAMTSS